MLLALSTRLPGWFLVFLRLLSAWLPIPEFCFFLGWRIFSIPVFPGIWLDFNLITAIQVPLQIILLAWNIYQQSWHNFYTGVGPYVLFISLWIFCRDLASHGSIVHLITLSMAALLGLFLLPFVFVLLPASPMFVLWYFGLSWQFFLSMSSLIVAGILVWIVIKNFNWVKETRLLNIPLNYLILGQFLVVVPVSLGVTVVYAQSYSPTTLPVVHTEEYLKYCSPQLWQAHSNSVQTQINCLHLRDRLMQGKALVESVEITRVANSNEESLQRLPMSGRITLSCLMGETKPMCGSDDTMSTCVYKGCHFDSSNVYTVHIKGSFSQDVDLKNSVSVVFVITLSHMQLNGSVFSLLSNGDKIQFNAVISEGMGSEKVTLILKSLSSPVGNYSLNSSQIDVEEASLTVMTEAGSAIKQMVNFVLEISIGYTPSEHYKPK